MSEITKQQQREYKKVFEQFDTDDNGCLDWDEFRKLLTELNKEMSLEEKLAAFHEVDTNHSGRIDFDEFIAWWSKRSAAN